MRWFIGLQASPGSEYVASSPGKPAGVPEVWTVGDWPSWHVTVRERADVAVVILGTLLADVHDLDATIDRAAATGLWYQMAGLAGSFTAIVRDAHDGVVVVPDVAGLHAVYYTAVSEDGAVWFSSAAWPLASRGVVDAAWLAMQLALPSTPDLHGDLAPFRGVCRARPGHVIEFRHGRAVESPLPVRMATTDLATGAARFRNALSTAVARRCLAVEGAGGSVSSFCSGGLDSTTLTVLAARASRSRITAITEADPVSNNRDDLQHATACLRQVPNVEHRVVQAPAEYGPFALLDAAPGSLEPSEELFLHALTRRSLAPVTTEPSPHRLHFCGDGGDAVTVGSLGYLADLARCRRFAALYAEATGWARLRHQPAWRLLRQAKATARVRFAQTVRSIAAHLEAEHPPVRGSRWPIPWCTAGDGAAWIPRRHRHEMAERLRGELSQDLSVHEGADGQALRMLRGNADAARIDIEIARSYGIDLNLPFFDAPVVHACLAVPVRDRTTVRQAKPLLASAMAGVVPSAILSRSTKGDYTASRYAGIARHSHQLHALLSESHLADLGVLDPVPARDALDRASNGLRAPLAALCSVLATEIWLRQIDSTHPFGPVTNP